VIVDNLDIKCVAVRPAKANPPLVVDAYAVLPFPVAFQRFEPIPGRNPEMIQRTCLIEIKKLAPRWPLNDPEPGYESVLKQCLDVRRSKGLDHTERVLRMA